MIMNRSTVVVAAGSAAAGASIMACLVTIVVLMSFKMYRQFTYRLYLYTLIMLTLYSVTEILHLTFLYKDDNRKFLFVGYVYSFFFYVSLSLMSSYIFYLHKLALYYQVHNKFVYDLNYCVASLILPILSIISLKVVCDNFVNSDDDFDSTNTSPVISCTHMNIFRVVLMLFFATLMIVFTFNGIFISSIIVLLCLKACGCIATTLTKDRYQRAFKETIPLLILPIATQMYTYYACIAHYVVPIFKLETYGLPIQLVSAVLGGLIGLVASLSFGLHLCILGKRKLRKLRGYTRKPPVAAAGYGTMNQQHTDNTTEYTAPGISETCNTTFPHVSEDDVDREILMGQRMRH